jgi:hypothetical protein
LELGQTTPPCFSMRFFSAGTFGLWSVERGTARSPASDASKEVASSGESSPAEAAASLEKAAAFVRHEGQRQPNCRRMRHVLQEEVSDDEEEEEEEGEEEEDVKSTARESPTFATHTVLPRCSMTTAVDPSKRSSDSARRKNFSDVVAYPSRSACSNFKWGGGRNFQCIYVLKENQ